MFNLSWPLKKISINQKFGEKAPIYTQLGLLGHDGLDCQATTGTEVYASHDGRVTFAGYDSARGLGIKIRTEETYDYQGKEVYWQTLYWHLDTGSLKVTASQKVKKGDLIAKSDNTGLSTGPHLHYALMPMLRSPDKVDFFPVDSNNGYRGFIDPMPYLPNFKEFSTKLKMGDTGTEVEKLQAFLIRNGFMPPQSILGFYGPITRQGVFNFQLKYVPMNWIEKNVYKGQYVGEKTLLAINDFHERT